MPEGYREKQKEDTVQLIRKRYERACKHQWGYLVETEEAAQYYKGNHYLRYVDGRFVTPKRKKWQVRLTINKLPTIVESILSTFLSVKPIIQTVPQSNEDEDRKASRITRQVLRAYWEKTEMDQKLPDILRHMLVQSNVWVRPRWDPTEGPKVETYKTETDEETGEEIETEEVDEEIPLGDLTVDILPAGSVMFEPGASSFDDAAWVIVVQSLRRYEVESRFDVELDEQDLEANAELDAPVFTPKTLSGEESDTKERVDLYQMYELPCRNHPDGRIVYATVNKKLAEEPLPQGEIEIVHIQATKLVDELLGTGPVVQAIPLQAEYNRMRSDMIENRRLMGRPKVLAPEGSIREKAINTQPGQIIRWDPILAQGHKPEFVRISPNTQSDFAELNLCNDEINDVTSRHDVSQGDASTQIKSGRHGEVLLASDNKRYMATMLDVEHQLSKLGKYEIRIIKRNLDDERLMTVTGRNYETEAVSFRDVDIDDGCNVKFEILSQMPWDQESMRQQALILYQQGLIDDVELKARLRQPLVDELHETEQNERINARAENQMLQQVYFQPVGTEKHNVHIEEHRAWINKPETWRKILEYKGMLAQQEQMAPTQPQMPGMEMQQPQQPQQPAYPPDVLNVLRHMEDHRKAIPAPAEQVRTSFNVRSEVPPEVAMQKVAGAMSAQQQAQPTDDKPSPKPMGSPEGGKSGEMYTPKTDSLEQQAAGLDV